MFDLMFTELYEGLEYTQKALRTKDIDDLEIVVMTNMAIEQYEQRNFKFAIDVFNRLIKRKNRWDFYYNIGVIYWIMENEPNAINYLQKALSFTDLEYYEILIKFLLGKIYFKIGEYNNVIRCLDDVRKFKEYKIEETYYWLAFCHYKTKFYYRAR
ncbi:MAG: hypothetical protein HZR80_05000 [Candidatus Heimdallarchaeota archaeon]